MENESGKGLKGEDCCIIYRSPSGKAKARFAINVSVGHEKRIFFCKSFLLNVIFALVCLKLSNDLSGRIKSCIGGKREQGDQTLTAWASWIGEVPTAAELYGDASSEVPSGEGFDDDDEDEELDASATNDYPENDESYEDADDQQESSLRHRWMEPPGTARSLSRRPKRDIEDVSSWSTPDVMENRIPLEQEQENAQSRVRRRIQDDIDGSFNVDDGNEDAWVHDGVDDIHIDPETRHAANQLNQDQAANSLDAEYEPQGSGAGQSAGADEQSETGDNKAASSSALPTDEHGNPIVNRTRITTISEVIPTRVRSQEGGGGGGGDDDQESDSRDFQDEQAFDNQDSSVIKKQYAFPESLKSQQENGYLPASHLSIDQIQQLFNVQAQ